MSDRPGCNVLLANGAFSLKTKYTCMCPEILVFPVILFQTKLPGCSGLL